MYILSFKFQMEVMSTNKKAIHITFTYIFHIISKDQQWQHLQGMLTTKDEPDYNLFTALSETNH